MNANRLKSYRIFCLIVNKNQKHKRIHLIGANTLYSQIINKVCSLHINLLVLFLLKAKFQMNINKFKKPINFKQPNVLFLQDSLDKTDQLGGLLF